MLRIRQLRFISFFVLIILFNSGLFGQKYGTLSGGLESNFNFFMRDSLIGADNIPQYDNLLYGAETWLNLRYNYDTWEMGVRFDMFNNSNLKDPNSAYSDEGIGNWFIKKKIKKLEVTAGHIYDQIGSGTIFRAYEERALFIDNSLYGLRLKYDLTENWNLKGFTGRQKLLFETDPAIIRGANIDGYFTIGKENQISFAPGIGFVNRTHDNKTITKLVNIVKNYLPEDQTPPVYNTYLSTVYTTISYNAYTLYFEGSMKSDEMFYDPNADKKEITGEIVKGKYVKKPGSILYTSLSYAKNKLGITAEYKRTENFDFRTDPTLLLNHGLINYIPPMNRLNTYTLTARYSPATQLLSEHAYQLDLKYAINRKLSFNVNFSNVTDLNEELLYREIYTEVYYKKGRKWKLVTGVQYQSYNQPVYEGEGTEQLVAYTPYVDFLYKISRKKSINFEAQYMHTEQDYGSWINLFVEFSMAPHWSFEASSMYNVSPTERAPKDEDGNFLSIIYPSLGVTYTNGSNRFAIKYVKQVEGVVCSGGVCRLEPAFSGIKLNVASRF